MGGLKPIVELMTVNFGLLAMDQIVNHAAKIHYMFGGNANVPMVIRTPQGGGHQLGAQHSQSLEAYFHALPGAARGRFRRRRPTPRGCSRPRSARTIR